MKKSLFLICLTVASSLHAAIPLVDDGKPSVVIVIPAEAPRYIEGCAGLLRDYIRLMSTASLQIMNDRQFQGGAAIFVGKCQQIDSNLPALDPGAYLIKTLDNNQLILWGPDWPDWKEIPPTMREPRGTYHAVAHFIEILGIKHFFEFSSDPQTDFGLDIPINKTLMIDDLNIVEHPGFLVREYGPIHMRWRRHVRTGKSIMALLGAHGWHYIMPASKYFKDHPEYYGLFNAKRQLIRPDLGGPALCTSNPDVVRLFSENVAELFRDGFEFVTIGGPDSFGRSVPICECAQCRALDLPPLDGDSSPLAGTEDRFWTFVNQVAEQSTKGSPGCYVSAPRYGMTDKLPRKVKIHPKVMPEICVDWWLSADQARDQINDYRRNFPCRKFSVFEYDSCIWDMLLCGPVNIIDHIAAKRRMYAGMEQCLGVIDCGTGRSWNAYKIPALYMQARLLWSPKMDLRKMKRDYYRDCFGPAAQPMRQYDDLWRASFREGQKAAEAAQVHHGGLSNLIDLHKRMYPGKLMAQAARFLATAKASVPEESNYYRRIDFFEDGFKYWDLTLKAERHFEGSYDPLDQKTIQDVLKMKVFLDQRKDFILSLADKYANFDRKNKDRLLLPIDRDAIELRYAPFNLNIEKVLMAFRARKPPNLTAHGWLNYHAISGDLQKSGAGCPDPIARSGSFCQKIEASRNNQDNFPVAGLCRSVKVFPGNKYVFSAWVCIPQKKSDDTVKICICDSKEGVDCSADMVNKVGEWQQLRCEFTPTQNGVTLQIKGTTTYLVDDAVFSKDGDSENLLENPSFELFDLSELPQTVNCRPGTLANPQSITNALLSQEKLPFTSNDGTPGVVSAHAQMMCDEANVYVFFHCEEPDMTSIVSQAAGQDDPKIWESDSVEAMINVRGKGKEYFHFAATSNGARYDARVDLSKRERLDENYLPMSPFDAAWTSDFKLHCTKSANSWDLVMVIPLKSMGVGRPSDGATWSVNLYRTRPRGNQPQYYSWNPTFTGFHEPGFFALVKFHVLPKE